MTSIAENTKITLNNHVEIPILGLGVWKISEGEATYRTVKNALELGYRHIDTAMIYQNEKSVGEAIRDSGIGREKIFVTTKVWNSDQGYENTLAAFNESRANLGLSYIDLYLIHWPEPDTRTETWRALETLLATGKTRAIGVSNYTQRHLEELLEHSQITPAINQVEFSPFLFQRELMEFCSSHGIKMEAYSPLTKGKRLSDNRLVKVAKKYGKTPAQILIRWAIEHEIVVIPKAANLEHLKENLAVFDFQIGAAEMDLLDSLNDNYRTAWDPNKIL